MRTPQLPWFPLMIAAAIAAGCNRAETTASTREAAADVKAAATKAGEQIADSWITTKIQAQFFADNDIKARYLNVSTRDGRVTLTGRVETENARQQAVQIARSTDGVREVDDRLIVGPLSQAQRGSRTPEQMDSAWLTTKIQAKYFADPNVNGHEINVSTTNGVVTLTGRVDTEQQKQQAVSIARSTDGVVRVEDRLVVEPRGAVATSGAGANQRITEKIDDARITGTIQSKYFLDDQVKGRKIDVDTRQGVVTLRGEVASESERAQALLLARNTAGVQRLEDMLTVSAAVTGTSGVTPGTPSDRAGERIDDAWVATKIQSEFFLDDKVKAGAIEVQAKDGVVLLQGTVPNEAARQQALTIARRTNGVVQVVDRLKVARK